MDKETDKNSPIYRAYVLMEEGDHYEKDEEFVYAIFKYQNAVEILDAIGLSKEKIEEVDKRIQDLEQKYQFQKQNTSNKAIQLKLVSQWIEVSIELEQNRDFERAIQCYKKSREIINSSLLDDSLLVKIEDSIERLNTYLAEIPVRKEYSSISNRENDINILAVNQKISPLSNYHENKLQEYKIHKQKREQLQDEAFKLLDEANKKIKAYKPDFDQAIKLYETSHELLLSAGWTSEAETIKEIIKNLTFTKQNLIKKTVTGEDIKERSHISSGDLDTEKLILKDQEKKRMLQLNEFQKNKNERIRIEKLAFDHLDEASNQRNMHNYKVAADEFKNALPLFKKIGWNEQIDLIMEEIGKMEKLHKEKEAKEKLDQNIKKLEENDNAFLLQQKMEKEREGIDQLKVISNMLKKASDEISRQNQAIQSEKIKSQIEIKREIKEADQVKDEIRRIAEKIKESKKS